MRILSRQDIQMLYIARFIDSYIEDINNSLEQNDPRTKLTKCQRVWLGYCLSGILRCNCIDWVKFSKSGLGCYDYAALSYMFRNSPIDWSLLFVESMKLILKEYGISEGVLVVDDSDIERSKSASKLHKLGKIKDKKTGGYVNGQCIVFLVLVSQEVTIPVGFAFYQYDPLHSKWIKSDKRLRKLGVPCNHRPTAPEKDKEQYPSKIELGIELISQFQSNFSDFKVTGILADCLYGTAQWAQELGGVYSKTQILSQLRCNQKIQIGNEEYSLEEYFAGKTLIAKQVLLRNKAVAIYYSVTIAKVKAQDAKRLIIAYKFKGADKVRYLFATDMTWQVSQVIALYSLRWLVEVFIQDWKQYEGFGQLAKQTGEDGSRKAVTLSLLFDHSLILHSLQKARIKDKLPVYTTGSLRDRAQQEWLIEFIQKIVEQPNAKQLWEQIAQQVKQTYQLKDSKKHFSGQEFRFGKAA